MKISSDGYAEIPVTHDGEGLNGVIRDLNHIGYYATIIGNLGDVVILYGPRHDIGSKRYPTAALVGDTILTAVLSHPEHQNSNRQ